MTGLEKIIPLDKRDIKFLTYDLGLAAVLITLGYTLVDVDKSNHIKSQFIFSRDEHIDKMVNEYWDDKLMLPARSLLENQKMLKNRLYSVME
ncbi:MAG: hypothetical protein EHM58_15265 [Ignavibacteriae bacterium]|nr:MAG: hypothetical protein EHM58_15265 [Ignavibacteriota bacterium]